MNKELLKLLPSDQELAKLSKQVDATLTSREHLLAQIGTLDLRSMELEEKMVYVLGLVSLGFDELRARKRLEVPSSHFYIWKQDEKHQAMLDNAVARGELALEAKVLARAEQDPEMAFKLLKEKQRKQEKKEDREVEKAKNVWDIMQESAQKRGLIQEGEVVDEVLQ